MRKFFCDHCGGECDAPLREEWYRTEIRLPKLSFTGHLCDGCARKAAEFFGQKYPRTSTGAQPLPEVATA